MNFFLIINTEQVGPSTIGELIEMWKAGEINSATFYWREGMPDWLPLGSLVSDVIDAAEKLPTPPKTSAPPMAVATPEEVSAVAASVAKITEPVIKTDPVSNVSGSVLNVSGSAGVPQPAAPIAAPSTATPLVSAATVTPVVTTDAPKKRKRGMTWVEWAIVLIFIICIALLLIYNT